MTQALVLDALNDSSIIEIKNDVFPSKDDWCLVANYSEHYVSTYVKEMRSLLNKVVDVETDEHHDLGSGHFKIPLLKTNDVILTYDQARMLELIRPYRLKIENDFVIVTRGMASADNFRLPLERINVHKYYDTDLLSYYFAGVREHLLISKFRCFYNILEYFFEHAPQKLGETSSRERDQISCVIRWVSPVGTLKSFLLSQDISYIQKIQSDLYLSSGGKVNALSLSMSNLEHQVSEWLYVIRCAIVHSKKTRGGKIEARFIPYTEDEKIADIAMPIIQYLAVFCIDKDGEVLP